MADIKLTDHSRLRYLQRVKNVCLKDTEVVPSSVADVVQKMNGNAKVLYNKNCYIFENYVLITIISRKRTNFKNELIIEV